MLNKFKISSKAFNLAILFGLLCAAFLSFADFNASCDDLRANVLRLHIIANSDSGEDQALKLKIRDRILEESGDLFEGVADIDNAVLKAEQNADYYCEIANRVIKENGYDYKAEATVGYSYFETREYEDFTLPAGNYKSLIISLGEAKGKNWWCVIFPEVCIPAATADLSDTVTEESSHIAEQPQRYIMRFKIAEIYENIKKLIKD
ncbi:MAG: stage II sporulation protein R [Clostridia bacterium]|nr:stage II sporulation protein R [Clostridia bacterium]